ncbi:MAG TPA: hypothetical protein VK698_13690 [Kofleriaceae bacterium]|nr:hypothetical protein [Kofleriaceae bacterium]
MIRTRAAALHVLTVAASWSAACTGGSSAYRASSPNAPASTEVAYSDQSIVSPGAGAESGPAEAEAAQPDRPGLGTEFGESVHSRVEEQPFQRAAGEPFALVAIHYNDEEGVRAQADSRGGALAPLIASTPQGGISVAVTDESGTPLPGVAADGRSYVIGRAGQRYHLLVTNHTAGRYELVASVDGLDVIDGRPGSYGKRGYIVPPGGSLTIEGFRTSDDTVAAFRFSSVRDSYAARTGDGRNVGVVGLAFFAELGSQWTSDEVGLRETADPFPDRYAAPPP